MPQRGKMQLCRTKYYNRQYFAGCSQKQRFLLPLLCFMERLALRQSCSHSPLRSGLIERRSQAEQSPQDSGIFNRFADAGKRLHSITGVPARCIEDVLGPWPPWQSFGAQKFTLCHRQLSIDRLQLLGRSSQTSHTALVELVRRSLELGNARSSAEKSISGGLLNGPGNAIGFCGSAAS